MFERILVVCTGNVCRSPIAAALLKERLPECHIESAGLNALVGEPCDPSARALAEAEGLNLSTHEARQITADIIRQADLILVMSEGQRLTLASQAPEATGKTLLFGHWLPSGTTKDIADPYKRSSEAFIHVHKRLVEAADAWQQKLQ